MFIGTQCDLWGKPDGTEHDKNKSKEISSTYFYALIPVYLSGNNSIGFHFQPHPHDSHTVQQPVAVKHTPQYCVSSIGGMLHNAVFILVCLLGGLLRWDAA